ncbi:MAG: dTDP-glucose 4,6-dehydratase [Asgard group archaeon]|nr:dTDP-glucose 4,6-dehydratase [Asgard group archaeon]
MNWIVTGGCGFIGSNFIHYAFQKYEDVEITNIDKLTYAGNPENLRNLENNPHYKFFKGDIADYSLLSDIFNKDIDLVINFAAETHVDRSIEGGDEFINTNILGTHALLKFCLKYDIRFVQISTDEVYGSSKEGYFTENDILEPSSLYSSSKAGADLLVKSYDVTYGLSVNITRSSNNFGPYQYPEKLIPLFITNLMRKKKVPVYGTGQNIREWIYVEDNCSSIDTVIQKGKKGEIYNLGSGVEKTNLEITNLILSKLGYGKEMIDFVPDRLGHDFRYALDTTKIRNLGWRPEFSFEEAFDLTIDWYKKNQLWWEPLLVT